MFKNQRCLILDESGNLGPSGRYFVIACIDTCNAKSLHNVMKRKLRQAKSLFPKLGMLHANEIKAKDAYPCIKYHILETITTKNLKVSYIVVDLAHVQNNLLVDKNIMYNYAAKLLLSRLISSSDNGSVINILFDNKTTKISSKNSLADYLKIHFIYEKGLNISINFMYLDSDASDAFVVQAADYVANAIYSKYEYSTSIYYDLLKGKFDKIEQFPYLNFGK